MSKKTELSELIQHDLITILDGFNDDIVDRVCDVIVNRLNELCEICESNEKEYTEGKWCASCKDQFKESENR